MKFLAASCLALVWLSSPAHSQTPIRILPMGDSITFGSGGTAGLGGYRGPLYDLLVNAGHSIDYVGTSTDNSSLLADMDHEGHGGWTIQNLDDNVAGWFDAIADPDIILLHIGTNDFGADANAINRLDALITKMAGLRPGAHIIVTNLMERGEPQNTSIQNLFNPFVPGVVDDHIAAGDLVSFLDMRAAVPLSDMPDNLHPNQTGYDKMAAAWLGAIEAIIDLDDSVPPSILAASSSQSRDQVIVRFNRPLDQTTAETASNYALDVGLSVLSAVLSTNQRVVTLSTDAQTPGETYTLTVNNVQDQVTPTPNTIATDSMAEFTTAPLPPPPGAVGRVSAAELDGMELLYAVDNDQFNFNDPYTIDNSVAHPTDSFARVAYFVELGSAGNSQWVWASMDTFNNDPLLVGVPKAGTNIVENGTVVTNLNVESNHPVLAPVIGTGKSGIIEFWASNYDSNGAGAFGSDDGLFDWKDGGEQSTNGGHGSFQVFAFTDATQSVANTVFGITANGGAGIGDQPGNGPNTNSPDWTFGPGTGTYEIRNVEIWVGVGEGELPPLALVSASGDQSGDQITVTFNRPLDQTTAETASNYTLSDGLTVLSAVLSANERVVILTTDAQTPGETYTLTVNNVQDQAMPTPNTVATDSMTDFTAPLPPPPPGAINHVSAAELDGMELLYAVNDGQFDFNDAYTIDNSIDHPTDSFTRVAYFVELGSAGNTQWVWAAMDTFKTDPLLVGVPRAGTNIVENGTVVTNLSVESNHPNLAGVVGTGKSGTIEFWASNYDSNGGGQFGSDDTLFDWKDGGDQTTNAGHGSFQVFAFTDATMTSANTLFGITANGGSGIGDQPGHPPGDSPDWTFGPGTDTYEIRNVEIWVGVGEGGELPPLALVSASGHQSGNQIVVAFNRPLDPTTAENASNYTLDGGLTVLSAVLSANQRVVTLTTSAQSPGSAYTLTVNGVQDLAMPTPNTVTADSMTEFTTPLPPPPPGAIGRVSATELAGMQLLYAVDNDQFDFNDTYTIDNSVDHPTGSFPRVGYFVELGPAEDTQWAWASMDTFNPDPLLVGVPKAGTGIVENGTLVTNLNVESNHPNLAGVVGTGKDGIIEFWASNYDSNGVGEFGSDDGLFDWKDGGEQSTNGGHGSFQVFAFTDATMTSANTVFGITANGGSGIGDQPANGPNANSPDWTFGPGTGTYAVRNVEIWVGSGAPPTPFEIVELSLNAAGDEATITWNSIPNAIYAVEYSLDLSEWIEIDDSIDSGGLMTSFLTTTAVEGVPRRRLFYRIRLAQ